MKALATVKAINDPQSDGDQAQKNDLLITYTIGGTLTLLELLSFTDFECV